MSGTCGLCFGKKRFHAGNGVWIDFPNCRAGASKVTLADAVQARGARVASSEGAPTVLKFIVPGEPVPKGRPRFSSRKRDDGKTFVKTYTDAETAAYEKHVRNCAQIAVLQTRWAWSKRDRFNLLLRVFRTHYDAGGDIDNYEKAVMDAMNTVAYADDRYVRGKGSIIYMDKLNPRVEVEVRRFLRSG